MHEWEGIAKTERAPRGGREEITAVSMQWRAHEGEGRDHGRKKQRRQGDEACAARGEGGEAGRGELLNRGKSVRVRWLRLRIFDGQASLPLWGVNACALYKDLYACASECGCS
jgi:hypothetical protein